jgi:hypothetical protein
MSVVPTGKMPVLQLSGEGGKKVRCRAGIIGQEPEYLSGSPHSVAVALLATPKRGEGGCATPTRPAETRLQQTSSQKEE